MRGMKTAVTGLLYLSICWVGQAAEWKPVAPEDLAMKKSKADPNADAECLFRDVKIENNVTGSVQNATTNYIRFKIFNERGAAKYADRLIEYDNDEHVSDVSARTIHPDGTIIDVKKDAIFNKVAAKKGGYKVHVISFTFPSVEPGSIIEYRWTLNAGENLYRYIPLDVQTDFPVDEVIFHVKPAVGIYSTMPNMLAMPFHCEPTGGNRDNQGFVQYTVRNVPAYRDEPYSPPGRTSRQWILLYYAENDNTDQQKYWNSVGRNAYNEAKEHIKLNGEMKQAAAEIVSKGKTDDEKLAALAEYCRKSIKNIWGPDITTEEKEAYKANNSTTDTFKRKVGTSEDIQNLFIALAQAAGYEAREAMLADRRSFLFTPQLRSAFFLRNSDAAVRVNDKWKFYDVTSEALPPGTLHWPEQGVYALIADPKSSEWVQTPLLTSDDTKIQRIATLTLSETGDIEGDVREIRWGNEGIDWRLSHGRQNDSERETFIREEIKERFADFDVKNIRVTIAPEATKPVGVAYHLSVKGFAQRTGKRIFLRPSFFTAGEPALFTDSQRTNALFFNYPWSELDSITIQLPAGFQLDHPEAAPSFQFAPVGSYNVKVNHDAAKNVLTIERRLIFGADQPLVFDASIYQQMKAVWDQIHSSDEHVITLRAMETAAPTK